MAKRRRRRLNPRFLLLCTTLALLPTLGVLLWRRSARLPAQDVALPEYVTEDYLTLNPNSRPGTPLEKISGVVIHYVGNPGTSAQANRNFFQNLAVTQETSVSAHFVVGLEGEIIACVPMTEIAYASNSRNSDTLSIEVCHPDDTGEFLPESYAAVVELSAWLCDTFDLSPEEDVIRHYDVTGKECPRYYVQHPEAWEALKSDIAQAREKK